METHMDKPCDICGDVGFDDLIATCSRCGKVREHVYCMWSSLNKVPEVWFCEPCRLSMDKVSLKYAQKEHFPKALTSNSGIVHCDVTHSVGNRKLPDGSGRQNYNKRQKIVETAKVKFISAEEAIMLSSGIKKVESPVQSNVVKSPRPSITVAPLSNWIPIGSSKTVTPKFSQSKVKSNPSFGHPGLLKPLRQISVKQAPQASKEFKETKTLVAPAKENLGREQPIEALKSANERKTSNTKVEKATTKASCASSSMPCLPFVSSGGNFCADAELRSSNVKEKSLLNILSTLKNYIPNPPRMDATWKGSFKILGSPGKPYDGFQAHPPFKVNRKAYEFSKRMPPVLQFKLLPRCNLWADIFQDDCPDEDDIALYIVPGDVERSKQIYACLLEDLEMHDLVMRSYMDGVELLIFASNQLQLHVETQKLNMKYFLWGVFRRVKENEAVTDEHKELPLLVSPWEFTQDDHANEDNGEPCDMDIDMIGGKNMGRIDVVVSRESNGRLNGSSWAESVHVIISQKSDGKIPTVSGNLSSTIQQPLLEVKREQRHNDHDLSPGVLQKVKSEFPFERPFQSSLEKFSTSTNNLDFPPGFKGIIRHERWPMLDCHHL